VNSTKIWAKTNLTELNKYKVLLISIYYYCRHLTLHSEFVIVESSLTNNKKREREKRVKQYITGTGNLWIRIANFLAKGSLTVWICSGRKGGKDWEETTLSLKLDLLKGKMWEEPKGWEKSETIIDYCC
jgi:hypothetical protein